jgi:hypothetical protein
VGGYSGPETRHPPQTDRPSRWSGWRSRTGLVSVGRHRLLAAEILGGQLVGIRFEPAAPIFFDPATPTLLRTRPNPRTPAEIARLRGARPAGPPPRPAAEPVRVQRRASATGVILVAGQKAALGHVHAGLDGEQLPSRCAASRASGHGPLPQLPSRASDEGK